MLRRAPIEWMLNETPSRGHAIAKDYLPPPRSSSSDDETSMRGSQETDLRMFLASPTLKEGRLKRLFDIVETSEVEHSGSQIVLVEVLDSFGLVELVKDKGVKRLGNVDERQATDSKNRNQCKARPRK